MSKGELLYLPAKTFHLTFAKYSVGNLTDWGSVLKRREGGGQASWQAGRQRESRVGSWGEMIDFNV